MSQKLSALLIIVILLVGMVSVSSNFALADDKDKDKGKKKPPVTLASFCAKIDDKNSFEALVCLAISDLYTKIQNISLTPGPQGPPGPPGTVNAQTCPSGDYVSGIAQGGTLICTQLPSGSTAPVCGNGIVESGETCDTSKIDTASCNGLTCTTTVCGDGYINKAAGEQCDDGSISDTATCIQSPAAGALDCKISVCGDGYVNISAGEQCDSSKSDTASCNGLTCKISVCGDGYVNPAAGEQCDLGALNSNNPGSTCNTSCKIPQ